MSQHEFEASVRQLGGHVIIDLQGEINAFADSDIKAAFAQAELTNPPVVLLNFGKVEYINSTGIALIVGLLAKARQSRREIKVFGLSEHYLEIFRITRLSDFMSIFPDEASAILQA
jgi:anti-sigma B factor antagonist